MKMVVLAYQAMKINGSRDGSVLIDIFIDLNNFNGARFTINCGFSLGLIFYELI
jgi:hypothetical protein